MHSAMAALLCVLILTLPACSQKSSSTTSNILRIAIEQDVKTLNPILASSTVDIFVQRLLFEPLITADVHGQPVPMLALSVPSVTNGGISRDGLTVTYHLRRSARWTDGMPVTSDDVKFSWSAIVNPQNNAVSRHGYDDIARIDSPDRFTAVVHLKRRFAPFVATFFAESDQPYSIVPAHVLRSYRDINQVGFNVNPAVSDGPFRFVSWAHGDRLILDRNEKFFLAMPRVRRIEIRVVPNENTSVNLLRTHEIDFMYQPSIITNPTIRQIPGVRVVWVDMNGYVGMQVNMSRPPLNDARVREAIARTIDKEELTRTLTFGQEHVASADIPNWMWASPRLPVLAPDLAYAKNLLRKAGRPAAPLLLVTDVANATHRRLTVEIQAMLHAVGIETTIKFYPADLLYAPAGMGGIMHTGRFDLAIVPWYAGIDPDNSSQLLCAMFPPNGYNLSRYCNPEMEVLQREALGSYDQSRRRTAYKKIEALVVRDNPIIPFWWMRQQEAISSHFKGFAPNPVTESWNAWQWSIQQK